MKKRILSILLTLVMVIGMLPMASLTAHAEGSGDDCYILINNTVIDDLNVPTTGTGWTYTPADTSTNTPPTIELHNYQGKKIHLYDPTPEDGVESYVELQIKVKGDCEITDPDYGIYLQTDASFSTGNSKGAHSHLYIYFENNASLTINADCGIQNSSFWPKTWIQGSSSGSNANLNITAGSYGIIADGTLVIEGSGGDKKELLYGGDIYIDNGIVLDVKAPTPFLNGGASPSKLIVTNGAMVSMTSTTDEDFINAEPYYLYSIPAEYTAYKNAKESVLQLYKPTIVSEVGVKDIEVPVVGETPDYAATADGNGYEINEIVWSYYDETISNEDPRWVTMNSGDTFEPGEKYLCTVEVVPSWYSTFPEAKDGLAAKFNGDVAEVSDVYSASKAYVEKEFTILEGGGEEVTSEIDLVNVDVTAPVAGENAVCDATDDHEGSTITDGKITWMKDGSTQVNEGVEFAPNTTYRCFVALSAVDGYMFTSDTKVYINGNEATYVRHWNELAHYYYDFTTGDAEGGGEEVTTEIDLVNVDVTAPVAGENAVCDATDDHEGSTITDGKITWMKDGSTQVNEGVEFAPNTTYRCFVALSAVDGYIFTSDTKVYINGNEATYVRHWNELAHYYYDFTTGDAEGGEVETPFVDYITISDVIAPVAGADTSIAPNYVVDSAADYTVEKAEWWMNDSDSKATEFVAGTNYRAVFTVIPKEGVVFDSPLTVKINGNDATVISSSEDKVVVSISLTATGAPVIPDTYTVTFDSKGGSAVAAQTVEEGQAATKPTDPTKAGYAFKGWYLDGTKYDFSTPVTKSITLTAKWQKNSTGGGIVIPTVFPVTVKESDNGEVEASAKYAVPGSTVKLTVTPDEGYELDTLIVKSGSKFINVTEKNGKYQFVMPFGSATVTATFKAVNPYNDVDTDDWFYDDVLYVTLKDLMNGTGDGKFSPEITTDRAMLVTVLWRLEGCPVVDSPVAFDDVADGLWYSDAIDWASANGIVNGYGDGKFGPTDQITREQIMAILNRYAAYKNWTDGTALPMIPQYNCSIWAENNVIWAENNGLLDGLGVDVSDMTAKASRAELAAYLAKFYKEFAEN